MDMTNPHPDGFCPKCGYAMDPGTCPECGLRVYRSDLAAIPPNLQRIRTRRRVIRFGVVLGVLIIGWYGYRTVNWVKLLPTSTLLYLQGQ